jgi:hypothetical protein
MSKYQIDMFVTKILCADDPFIAAARRDMSKSSALTAYLIVHLACKALDDGPNGNDEYLFELLDGFTELHPDLASETEGDLLSDTVSDLEGSNIISRSDNYFTINVPELPLALCALFFDQKHRHGLDEMADYLWELLEIA